MPAPVYIEHLTHYHPDTELDNAFFEGFLETSDAWIQNHTGIRERRFMSDYHGSFPVFEIQRRAVDQLLQRGAFELDDADLVISCCCNSDLQYPTPANMLSEHYALERPAFHMQNGCSSAMYGLQVARGLLALGEYRRILLVTGEPFTNFADYGDRSSAIFFGDAASAMVLTTEPGPVELMNVKLGGKGSRVIQSTAPGATPEMRIHDVHGGTPAPDYAFDRMPARGVFRQDGRAVYDFVTNTMPGEIHAFAKSVGIRIDDFDHFIGHQANLHMLEALCSKLGIGPERHLHNVERFGNTSSAGWVTVLSEALEQGQLQSGERVLVSVFGAGLGWGTAAFEVQ